MSSSKRVLQFDNPLANKEEAESEIDIKDAVGKLDDHFYDLVQSTDKDGDINFDFSKLEAEDRRQHERFPNRSPIIVHHKNKVVAKGKMTDISLSGVGFHSSNRDLDLGGVITLELSGNLSLPDVIFDVKIINVGPLNQGEDCDFRYGAVIVKMSKLTFKKIQEYLTHPEE
ncbi:MAG: PilZ domain-containing protein [Bdellovibrionaceae bacterium]|jgi:hypothetical protein|nr:PilZ domain-containing protein [Pseudobdellovibrionaceae bacterium]